jgi:hypothetical protein
VTLGDDRAHVLTGACHALCHGQKRIATPACPGVAMARVGHGTVVPRRELLLEHHDHHDERLTDGGLDLAIGSSCGAQKTQGNYCTICCTSPDTGG